MHSELEESHFYPACREKNVESSLLAARRGWGHREDHNDSRSSRGGDDNRRGGNDDDRRGGNDDDRRGGGDHRRSSSDDNRRSSGAEDHGGWFGDSRGHSEAARRGWEHRNGR